MTWVYQSVYNILVTVILLYKYEASKSLSGLVTKVQFLLMSHVYRSLSVALL